MRKVALDDEIWAQGKAENECVKMNFQGKPFSVCIHSDLQNAYANCLAVRHKVDDLNVEQMR